MNQKVFVIVTVARQIDGDMISIRFEKAFSDMAKAEAYTKELNKVYQETIQTDQGPVKFLCERGIHQFEVEN